MDSLLTDSGYEVESWEPPAYVYRLVPQRFPSLRKWASYVDKYFFGVASLIPKSRDGYEFLHVIDHSDAIYLLELCLLGSRARTLVTCHDMTGIRAARNELPGIRVGRAGKVLQRLTAAGIRRADIVISVSSATAHSVRSTLGIETSVVWNYLDPAFEPVDAPQPLERRRHILTIGGLVPHKRRIDSLVLYSRLRDRLDRPYPLHIVGPPLSADELKVADVLGIVNDIKVLQGIDDESLKAEYEFALAYISTSRHEGFGWPVIEANSSGTPCVISSIPAFLEVGGPSALYVDDFDDEELIHDICMMLTQRYSSLCALALDNAQRFHRSTVATQWRLALDH